MVQEWPVRVERRLSAILAADVVGYSRLMHDNEEVTHTKLAMLLTEAVGPAITEHRGRIVKNTGDGFLAEFPSAVEAVRAAVRFQTRVAELTIGDAEGSRIAFRVGVNIGDVIIEPHDIFGDGVNIAARLETIAEPGGICISFSAYDHVRGKVGVEFADIGEQSLKNIARPVRAFAVVWEEQSPATHGVCAKSDTASAPHLSIVVLPFTNLSGDPEQEYFVDGVTESLTTDLSRICGAFVIARNTAFTFKGKALDVKKLGRELHVRYVLEGSVQRSGNRLRVNVQLVDAETGNHLWAERFDKPIADLFDMQDEIVSRLANALDAELIAAEARRAEHLVHPDTMDLVFQGRSCFNRGLIPDYMIQARHFFEQALALDPENIEAMVGLARVDQNLGASLMTDDRSARLVAAETTIAKVLSLAPKHASAHAIVGAVQIFTKRAAQSIAEFEQALALDHNLARAHALIGLAKLFLGRGEETESHVNEAIRLSPRDTFAAEWLIYVGIAKAQFGADAQAVSWMRRGLDANRNYSIAHFHLGAALARLGELEQARTAVQAGLALDPNFTIHRFRAHAPRDNPISLASRERLIEGMRMAGVPEG
ncbi:adenylate/guanylate cyclase domain-containing protein [Bradyrhizobium sp. CCBAU 51765]|uniref:adenylate/guanylate cyclase domain-containing protein n=1 Tax=Bradyrhizobium sp. CCBAU 51765 TaxID=1325102 RepID=UPI00188881F0|nr:adenylate/guanylate cyclase domain-containing protein [Bradyrhizobium sp. CCBAU 51765]QOZ09255.1 adenylate/guanylate cyclase domain-containing protein [Bradyrhizobium sp. CCBAU 51765]